MAEPHTGGARSHLESWDRQAAEARRPVAGPAAPSLFAIGLLGASLLAAVVVPLSSSYAVAEAAGAERSVSASLRQAPVFYGPFTLQLLGRAALVLAPRNLVSLVVSMQVGGGLIPPCCWSSCSCWTGAASSGTPSTVGCSGWWPRWPWGAIAVLALAVVVLHLTGAGS
jgi:Mn2+/Fe2+ NRAMP family transporter